MNLLLTAAFISATIPATRIIDSPAHESLHDAAKAGIQRAISYSVVVEYGGALLKCGDLFFFTEPVTQRKLRSVEFRAQVTTGCSLAGIYHTHPPHSPGRDSMFSANDIETAKQFGVPSYIGVISSKTMRMLDAGSGKRISRRGGGKEIAKL